MFRFKQFSVRQDRCPMKVGTDGVLLGAWAGVRPSDRRMLDIGTGTGLIALMLAQRAPEASVTGVDIDDVAQARENGDASPWGDRVVFERCPVQEFRAPEPFDLIVSNPPFFVDSLTCPDEGRTAARHAVHLPFDELRDAVLRLMAPAGDALAKRFETELFGTMKVPVLFNCLGREKADADSIPALLVKQVQSSVYMEDTLRRLGELGVDHILEVGPGSALSGFVKKTLPGVACASVETPAQLDAVLTAWKEEQ